MEKLQFIEDRSLGIEVVSLENVTISYPPHTHVDHYVFGIVTQGKILIDIADQSYECSQGEYFSVLPDVRHSIKPLSETYSMITTCLPKSDDISKELDIIKREIIGNPELELGIEQLSQRSI